MSTRKRLDQLERTLDKVYTALLVRDPGTPLSADAYDGLRKQVIAAAQERTSHLAQLSELDAALRRGASLENLRELSRQWLQQAGVTIVDDPSKAELFESTIEPGAIAEVELPAYVDTANGRIIRQGRLRQASHPKAPSASGDNDPPELADTATESGASA